MRACMLRINKSFTSCHNLCKRLLMNGKLDHNILTSLPLVHDHKYVISFMYLFMLLPPVLVQLANATASLLANLRVLQLASLSKSEPWYQTLSHDAASTDFSQAATVDAEQHYPHDRQQSSATSGGTTGGGGGGGATAPPPPPPPPPPGPHAPHQYGWSI